MKELIEKLTSYNIFNYLLPGALFAVFLEHITAYKIIQPDLVIGLFLYYFVGMVISRLGSLILEPLAKSTKFVTYADYRDFVTASSKDDRLDILSEANATYRTMCSLFVSLLAVKVYEVMSTRWSIPRTATSYGVVVALFLLFAFSYRKQTTYIVKRIEAGKR